MFRTGNSHAETEAQIAFLFHVVIGSNILGEFRAVRGLGRTVEPEEIREGGRNHSPHMMVGQGKYQQCRIEWGFSLRATLFDWIHAVEAGYGFRRLVWIFQLDRARNPLRVYQLWDAWPVSWEGARLDANDNLIDTEEINIAYELVTMVGSPGDIAIPSLENVDLTLTSDTTVEGWAQSIAWTAEEAETTVQPPRSFVSPRTWRAPKGKKGASDNEVEERKLLENTFRGTTGKEGASDNEAVDIAVPESAKATGGATDSGDEAKVSSEFEDVAFATGSFAEHATIAPLKMSGGVFVEPSEWDPLLLEGE